MTNLKGEQLNHRLLTAKLYCKIHAYLVDLMQIQRVCHDPSTRDIIKYGRSMCPENIIVTEAKYLRDTFLTLLIDCFRKRCYLNRYGSHDFYSCILSWSNMQHFYKASTLSPVLCCYDSKVCKDFFCVSIKHLNLIELMMWIYVLEYHKVALIKQKLFIINPEHFFFIFRPRWLINKCHQAKRPDSKLRVNMYHVTCNDLFMPFSASGKKY